MTEQTWNGHLALQRFISHKMGEPPARGVLSCRSSGGSSPARPPWAAWRRWAGGASSGWVRPGRCVLPGPGLRPGHRRPCFSLEDTEHRHQQPGRAPGTAKGSWASLPRDRLPPGRLLDLVVEALLLGGLPLPAVSHRHPEPLAPRLDSPEAPRGSHAQLQGTAPTAPPQAIGRQGLQPWLGCPGSGSAIGEMGRTWGAGVLGPAHPTDPPQPGFSPGHGWGRGVPPAGPQAPHWFLASQPAVGSRGRGQHQL